MFGIGKKKQNTQTAKPVVSLKDDPKVIAKNILETAQMFLNLNRDLYLEWLGFAAFARGIHYAVLDEDNYSLKTPLRPDGRKYSKINKIGSWMQHMISRVVAVRPEFEVIPSKQESGAIRAAVAGTAFLQDNSYEQDWIVKRHDIAKYSATFGISYVLIRDYEDTERFYPKPLFDVDGETPVIDPQTGRQKAELVPIEDVAIEVLLPHHVLCDNTPGSIDTKPEVILAFWRTMDYYESVYPDKAKSIQPETFGRRDGLFDLSLLGGSRASDARIQGATEFVYLRPPSANDPDGALIKSTGEVFLEGEKWPYSYLTNYPLAEFRWGPAEPGEYYTQSPIKSQIPIQMDMNEVASIIQENISNVGHIKWGVPLGSQIKDIDDLSGQMIEYNPAVGAPHQIQVATLPHYEVNHLLVLDKMLEDIQMFHSVSKGSGTPNVRSAVGLDKLGEEDQAPLDIIDAYFAHGYEQLGKKVLQVGAEKLSTPRLIRYVGQGRKKTIDDFTNEMLDGGSRVRVRMVDSYMRNKGATQNLILEMAHNGLVVDNLGRPDHNKVLNALKWALPDTLYDKQELQREMQYEENEQLLRGIEVPVEEWEYHFDHLDVLDELLNSWEFKMLAQENSRIKEVVVAHRNMHRDFIMQALQAQVSNTDQGS